VLLVSGTKVATALSRRRWKEASLARESGLDKNTVSGVIRAGAEGSWRQVSTVQALADALGVSTIEALLVDCAAPLEEDDLVTTIKATMNETSAPVAIASEYWHGAGSFRKEGDRWVEYPALPDGRHFVFTELVRDDKHLYLVDTTRMRDLRSAMYVRIPVAGGVVQWSFPNPLSWEDLCVVAPKRP